MPDVGYCGTELARYRDIMGLLPPPWDSYPDADGYDQTWCNLARQTGGRVAVAGTSVRGRALRRFDWGPPDGPAVLLTGLVHGVEFVGSMALLEFMRGVTCKPGDLVRNAHIVVVPIVNPDALHINCARLMAGRRAFQRSNARGVDLNRNFPRQREDFPWHPLGGSRWRLLPNYAGPQPLSEPESRAIH